MATHARISSSLQNPVYINGASKYKVVSCGRSLCCALKRPGLFGSALWIKLDESRATLGSIAAHMQQPKAEANVIQSEAELISPLMPSLVMQLASLQRPAVECSFPSMLNPQYEFVKQECDEWIESVAQPPSATMRRFLHACLLPRLVCRFIPLALPGPRLLHAIKFIAWLMVSDDDDDNPTLLGSDVSTTSHRAGLAMAILTDGLSASPVSEPYLSRRCCVRLEALAELWQDMRPAMSPRLRSRFISSMADYFEGLKMQATLRKERSIPNVETYMEIRRQASFTFPCFILVEYAMGIELDEEALQDDDIVELNSRAVDYISLCNDIFSCHKEITSGDFFNLPSILYANATTSGATTGRPTTVDTPSFQVVVENVAKTALEIHVHCQSLIETIKVRYSEPSVPLVRAYNISAHVASMALGMSGALAWFHETARYKKTCKTFEEH